MGPSVEELGRHSESAVLPLHAEALCAEARQRTGLADFGDPPLEPALSTLVNSLDLQADLHPLGRFLMRIHLGACSRLDCDSLRGGVSTVRPWIPRSFNDPFLLPECREVVPLSCTN
jgi:hypothetical protein